MKKILILMFVGAAFLVSQQSQACTIPVFRYALEKWELTPYEIMVFHRGPLSADLEKEFKRWDDAPRNANIEITRIDLDGKLTRSQQKLWTREGNDKQTPWMLVRYAPADSAEASAWRGPCTIANLNTVLDSPMRRAILAHLTRGASTVFVLLISDDAKADRAALDMVTKQLQTIEKKLKLPVQSDTGPQIKLPIPLKVSFPILVLDRKNAEEAGFISLLMGTEDRLVKVKGPMLFPIFGRGRVLGSLDSENLSEEQVLGVTNFLCRECSCQVKELNPGIDIIMVAHWNDAFDRLYDGKEAFPMPKLTPAALLAPEAGASVPNRTEVIPLETRTGVDANASTAKGFSLSTSPSMQAPTVEQHCENPCSLRLLLWFGIGIASAMVLLSGGWVIYQARK